MVKINAVDNRLQLPPETVQAMKAFSSHVGAAKMKDGLDILMDRMENILSGTSDARQAVREGQAPASLKIIFQAAAEKPQSDPLSVSINPAQALRLQVVHDKLVKCGVLGEGSTSSDAFSATLKAVTEAEKVMYRHHGELPSYGVSRRLESKGLA